MGEISYINDDGSITSAPTYTGAVQFLFPKMLSEGYIPLSTAELWRQQLRVSRTGDPEMKEKWFEEKNFLSGDLIVDDLQYRGWEFIQYQGRVVHYSGTFKIVLDPLPFLGSINPEIGENKNLTLTCEEYSAIESESYLRSQINQDSSSLRQSPHIHAYKREELTIDKLGLLPILARHPNAVSSQYALDENLLLDYIMEVRGGYVPAHELIDDLWRGRNPRSLKFLVMTHWNTINGMDNPRCTAVGKKLAEKSSGSDPLEVILNQIRPHINTQDRNGHSHMLDVRRILRKAISGDSD